MSLKGKSAVITGASKNLGDATANALAKEGVDILIHYHSDNEKNNAEKLSKNLSSKYGVKSVVFQGNLSDETTTAKMFDYAVKEFGGIDFAINNVGMVLRKPLADTTLKEFDTMYDVNTRSAFLFLRECANRLNEGGSVVMLTTSLLAAYTDGYSIYQSAKGSVHYMVKAISKEDKKKISYNCVSPGPMDTPFLYGQENDDRVAFFKTMSAQNRLTEVGDIVPIIRFLLKDGHWMTGQNLFASNGFTAPGC